MTTVLEGCNTEEQRSVVRFSWSKRLNEKVIHKEMFRVYYMKGFLCKTVHKCVEKFSKGRLIVVDDETEVR
jgi:hypothetical protein